MPSESESRSEVPPARLGGRHAPFTQSDHDGDVLADAREYLLSSSGSKWRSRLLLAAAGLGPDSENVNVQTAAEAVELLHLASLAHDDVIDSGSVRRGKATASTRFGPLTAGLIGTSMFSMASERFAECGDRVAIQFAYTAQRMCLGGMSEVSQLHDVRRSVHDYLMASRHKTASSFSFAAYIGAVLADCSDETALSARRFGEELGVAFQIWDDIGDLTSNGTATDKAAITDLRHGNYSAPVIFALQESRKLRRLLTDANTSDDIDSVALGVIRATDGLRRAAELADAFASRAVETCEALGSPREFRVLLQDVRRRACESNLPVIA